MGIAGWVLMIGLKGAPLGNINAGFSAGPFVYESGCKSAAENYKKKVNPYIEYTCESLETRGKQGE